MGGDPATISGELSGQLWPSDPGLLAGLSQALLGNVGNTFSEGSEAGEQRVALVLLGLPELGIGAVESVQDAQHTETLVEPATRKELVRVIFALQE